MCLSARVLALSGWVLASTACAVAPTSSTAAVDPDAAIDTPWHTLRAQPPRLVTSGPAPTTTTTLTLPTAPDVVFERAAVVGELTLAAVIARPLTAPLTSATPIEKLPALLLLHAGFALEADTLALAADAARRGFVVLAPTLRGENGNPGAFELLRGEVEDARAALRLLAQEPDVDPDRLYAFGVGEGGGLAALLAVDGDVPLRLVGALDGAFSPSMFLRWRAEDARRTPFVVDDANEAAVRALVPFAHQVKLPLVLYGRAADPLALAAARLAHARAAEARAPVELFVLEGDRAAALAHALDNYLSRCARDADATGSRPAPAVASASRR